MSVAIIGGNECMVRQYKKLCGEYQCKAKVYPKMTNGLRDIGTPDLLVLFTNTVSHTLTDEVRQPEGHVLRYTLEYKMVRSVLDQTKGKSVGTVRSHTSSMNALRGILKAHTAESGEGVYV